MRKVSIPSTKRKIVEWVRRGQRAFLAVAPTVPIRENNRMGFGYWWLPDGSATESSRLLIRFRDNNKFKTPEIGGIKKYQILMFKKLKKFNTLWKRVEKMAIFGYEFYFR